MHSARKSRGRVRSQKPFLEQTWSANALDFWHKHFHFKLMLRKKLRWLKSHGFWKIKTEKPPKPTWISHSGKDDRPLNKKIHLSPSNLTMAEKNPRRACSQCSGDMIGSSIVNMLYNARSASSVYDRNPYWLDPHRVVPVYTAHPPLFIFSAVKKSAHYTREFTVNIYLSALRFSFFSSHDFSRAGKPIQNRDASGLSVQGRNFFGNG